MEGHARDGLAPTGRVAPCEPTSIAALSRFRVRSISIHPGCHHVRRECLLSVRFATLAKNFFFDVNTHNRRIYRFAIEVDAAGAS
jgi:hypothetical protein